VARRWRCGEISSVSTAPSSSIDSICSMVSTMS
jgi:hypothetical protein